MHAAVFGPIIPLRFLTLLGHLTSICLTFYSRSANVLAQMQSQGDTSQDDYNSIDSTLQAGLALGVICCSLQLLTLAAGFSLFQMKYNIVHVIAHLTGSILMCYFIINAWDASSYWGLWIGCNVVPFALECEAILEVLYCRTIKYR